MIRRDNVVDELLAWADSAPESFLLLVGPAQSGRTWLLDETRRRTTSHVVSVASHFSERQYPLSGLAMLLNALGDVRLAEFAGRFILTDTSMEGTRSAARDVLLLLRGARIEPTLVIVDDTDLLDEHSQAVLAYMASRLTGTGLQVIASSIGLPAPAVFGGIPRIALRALGEADALALAAEIGGKDADPQVLALVCAASGSLPGVIKANVQLLSDQQRRGHAPLLLPLPPALSSHPVTPDGDPHPLLLRIAAGPLTSIAGLLPLEPDDQQALERLISEGVLDMLGFYVRLRSPELRSALYWGTPATVRRSLHSAAAAAEKRLNPSLATWHASQVDEASRATAALLSAARALVSDGYVPAGVELAERALLFAADPRPHMASLVELAEALADRGEFGLVSRYVGFARQWSVDGRDILAASTLDLIVKAVTTGRIPANEIEVQVDRFAATNPIECSEALATVAYLLGVTNDLREAHARLDQSRRLDDHSVSASGSTRFWVNRLFSAIDGNADAASEGDPATLPDFASLSSHTLLICGSALSMEERYGDARRAFAVLSVSHPRGDGHQVWADQILIAAAENEIRAGHVHEALALIDELRDATDSRSFRPTMLFGWAAAMRGRTDESQTYLDEAARIARGNHHPLANARLSAHQGSFALMRGDYDEARFRFDSVRQTTDVANPDFLRIAADHAETLYRLGADDRARRAVDEFAAADKAHGSRWSRGALARARVVVASDEQLVPAVRDALQATDDRNPFELARTSLSCAIALGRSGREVQAREYRRRAERIFDDSSALGWVSAVRALEDEPVGESLHPLLATLTDNEMAVLRLIRRGARNKDIAAALFVSLRTVEMRITQIYRKLDARSRSHLLTLLPAELTRSVDDR